jgi:hypothetical protein
MDSEWVGRAGILAGIISIVFLTPEVAGLERLQRLEEGLKRRFYDDFERRRWVSENALVWGLAAFLCAIGVCVILLVLTLAGIETIGHTRIVLVILGSAILGTISSFFALLLSAGAWIAVASLDLAFEDPDPGDPDIEPSTYRRAHRTLMVYLIITRALAIPVVLLVLLIEKLSVPVALTLATLGKWIVTRPGGARRAMVLVGLVLGIGGLVAQFYATF